MHHLLEDVPRWRGDGGQQDMRRPLCVRVHVDHRVVHAAVVHVRSVSTLELSKKGLATPYLPGAAASLDEVGVGARVGQDLLRRHLLKVLERLVQPAQLHAHVDERRVRLRVGRLVDSIDKVGEDGVVEVGVLHGGREEQIVRTVRRHPLLLLLQQQVHGLCQTARHQNILLHGLCVAPLAGPRAQRARRRSQRRNGAVQRRQDASLQQRQPPGERPP